MKPRRWITIPLVALSLAGAYISELLLDKHLLRSAGPAWFARVCGEEARPDDESAHQADGAAPTTPTSQPAARGKGSPDCAEVLASRWATMPPRPEVEDEILEAATAARQPPIRIPVAYLGLVYFLSLAIWFLFIGRPTADRPQWYRLPLAFVVVGVLFSVFYLMLMWVRMDEWCLWCVVTHVVNFLILGGMLYLRPQKLPAPAITPAAADSSLTEQGTEGPRDQGTKRSEEPTIYPSPLTPHPSHPSGRLVAACVLLAAATGAMFWNGYGAMVLQRQKGLVQARLTGFESNAVLLTAMYYNKPQVTIAVREDDPQTSQDENFCPLVVFSDFECPACRSFDLLVKRHLQRLFQDHIRVIWKHYPLCTECNPHVTRNTHAEACRAARAAEAARIQGGNEAFWKAHDRLFESQQQLKDFDYAALAKDLGLDAEKFVRDMNSEAVNQRIAEDIAQAKALGVSTTPAIFLYNRPVDGLLANLGTFWNHVAHSFNYQYDQKTYAEKMKRLQEQGQPVPTTQHDHSDHE